MSISGIRVRHARFGAGQITRAQEGYVLVQFDSPGTPPKWFVYPDAFERFLQLEDGENAEITAALRARQAAQQEKRDALYARIAEQSALRRQELLAARKTTARRSAKPKKAAEQKKS